MVARAEAGGLSDETATVSVRCSELRAAASAISKAAAPAASEPAGRVRHASRR